MQLRNIPLALMLSLLSPGLSAQSPITLVRADQQSVPVRVYGPQDSRCIGIVVISPGAGGAEKDLAFLAQAMAQHSRLTVVVGHLESGRAALKDKIREDGFRAGLTELITDRRAYEARYQDIAAAKAWARSQCPTGQAILMGHSMGAATSLMIAGAETRLGLSRPPESLAFDLYVVLSPQGVGEIFPPGAWHSIQKPVLSMTGTRDQELGSGRWQSRTTAFETMPPGCKWLGVIEGAGHFDFAGVSAFSGRTERLTVGLVSAFLDAAESGRCEQAPPDQRGLAVSIR